MIDSHCHLADEGFGDDLHEVVRRAKDAGLTRALCVLDATNEAETMRAAQVSELWPSTRFAAGVHPHQAGEFAGPVDRREIGHVLRRHSLNHAKHASLVRALHFLTDLLEVPVGSGTVLASRDGGAR